jgi:hypothetical protein
VHVEMGMVSERCPNGTHSGYCYGTMCGGLKLDPRLLKIAVDKISMVMSSETLPVLPDVSSSSGTTLC